MVSPRVGLGTSDDDDDGGPSATTSECGSWALVDMVFRHRRLLFTIFCAELLFTILFKKSLLPLFTIAKVWIFTSATMHYFYYFNDGFILHGAM